MQVFMQEIEVRSWIHRMYLRHTLQKARYEETRKIRNEVEKWSLKDSFMIERHAGGLAWRLSTTYNVLLVATVLSSHVFRWLRSGTPKKFTVEDTSSTNLHT